MHLEQGRARQTRFQKRALAVAAATFALSYGTLAAAQPPYPGELQKTHKMPCVPTCMLCHTDPEGGDEKLNDFAGTGFAAKNNPAADLSMDYDRDGKTDGEELRAGENPTIAGAVSVCIPEYGCGARVAKAPVSGQLQSEGLLLGALGFGLVLRWQLRRRTRAQR